MPSSLSVWVCCAATLGLLCMASDCQHTKTYTAYEVTRIESTPSGISLHVVKRHVIDKGWANGSSNAIVEEHDLTGEGLQRASEPVAYGALPNGNVLQGSTLLTAAGAPLWSLAQRAECAANEPVVGPALASDLASFGVVSSCDGVRLRLSVVRTDSGVVAVDVLFTTGTSRLLGLATAPDHRVAVVAPGLALLIATDGTTSPLEVDGPIVSAIGAGWVSKAAPGASTVRFSDANGITLRRVTLPGELATLADRAAPNVASGAFYYVLTMRPLEIVKDGDVISDPQLRIYDAEGNLVRELDPTF